jgi:predicted AlkP superfamily phosphohydrolase/phosphomutase
VGRLVDAAPPGTDIVVLSDHGFKLQHRLIHLAAWLRAEGYLVEKINSRQRLLQQVRRADIFKLRRHLAHWVLRDKTARFGAAASTALSRVDWQRSQAYTAIGSVFGCVYVNHSLVSDASGLVDELSGRLVSLTDPLSGRRVVERVIGGHEVYHGPFAQNGPDLIVEPAEDYTFGAPSLVAHPTPFTGIDFDLGIPGGHHPEGIVVWIGEGAKGVQGVQANLMDIAPTVLARLGIAIPRHMDGQVLQSFFESTLEPDFRSWEEDEAGSHDDAYSNADEEALRERLAGLGYL